jgi:preprotein translocase subunit SecG
MSHFWSDLFSILFAIASVFLVFIVLLQRGRGGGLAGAFGATGGQSAFGTKAGDVFTKITIVVAVIWVGLAGVTGYAMSKESKGRLEFHGTDQTSLDQGPANVIPDANDAGSQPAKNAATMKGAPAAKDAKQPGATAPAKTAPSTTTPATTVPGKTPPATSPASSSTTPAPAKTPPPSSSKTGS